MYMYMQSALRLSRTRLTYFMYIRNMHSVSFVYDCSCIYIRIRSQSVFTRFFMQMRVAPCLFCTRLSMYIRIRNKDPASVLCTKYFIHIHNKHSVSSVHDCSYVISTSHVLSVRDSLCTYVHNKRFVSVLCTS